jgi:hypothetical protein
MFSKIEQVKKGLDVFCKKHGFHKKWHLNEKFHQVRCDFCQSESAKKHNLSDHYLFNKYLIWSRSRCHKTGKEFNLDIEYICNLYIKQKGLCAISRIELNEDNLSLDRIDSNIGYIKGNVQWVDFTINRMKSDLKQSEFVKLCKLVALSKAKKK